MMLSRQLSSSLRPLICPLSVLLLLAMGFPQVCGAESARSLSQWVELIGLGAAKGHASDVANLNTQALTLAPPRASFLGRSAGHTRSEYLAGSAVPVKPSDIEGPGPTVKELVAGSFVKAIAFSESVDARNNPLRECSVFPWNTKQAFVTYACENPPAETPILQRTVIHRWPDGREARYEYPVDLATGRYREFLMLYQHEQAYLEPGLYTVELRVWDRLLARIQARVDEPQLDELQAYMAQLDGLRGSLYLLLMKGSESPTSSATLELAQRLVDGYLDAAYRAYLFGPDEENKLVEVRALTTAAALQAVVDINTPDGDPAHKKATDWLGRSAGLLVGINKRRAETAMADAALMPEKVSVLLASLPTPESAPLPLVGDGANWALLVGVNHYAFGSLRYAAEDARALAQVLYDPDGGAFEVGHIITMTDDSPAERKPTRANILRVLATEIKEAKPDTFVLYFAGHGFADPETRGHRQTYLLPLDADKSTEGKLRETALSLETLLDQLKDIEARCILVIVDACRDDPDQTRGINAGGLSEDLSRGLRMIGVRYSRATTTATLLACSPGEQAWEWSEKGHGVFTYFLMDGLKKGAADPNGLTLSELVTDVSARVSKWAEDNKHASQNPDAAPTPLPAIVLVRPRGAAPDITMGTASIP